MSVGGGVVGVAAGSVAVAVAAAGRLGDRAAVPGVTVFARVGVGEWADVAARVAAAGVRVTAGGVRRVANAAVHSAGKVGKGSVGLAIPAGTMVETGAAVAGRRRAGTNSGKAKIKP